MDLQIETELEPPPGWQELTSVSARCQESSQVGPSSREQLEPAHVQREGKQGQSKGDTHSVTTSTEMQRNVTQRCRARVRPQGCVGSPTLPRLCRVPLTHRTVLEATPWERECAGAPVAMACDSKPCCTSHREANSSLLELSQAAVASQ